MAVKALHARVNLPARAAADSAAVYLGSCLLRSLQAPPEAPRECDMVEIVRKRCECIGFRVHDRSSCIYTPTANAEGQCDMNAIGLRPC